MMVVSNSLSQHDCWCLFQLSCKTGDQKTAEMSSMGNNTSLGQNTTNGGPGGDDNIENLLPALVQIFLTILFGYLSGLFDVIGKLGKIIKNVEEFSRF